LAYDLKRKIHAGESILGVSVPMTLTRDEIESVMDGGSYDFVWVDGQHTPYNEDRLVAFCTAAAEIGVHVQFRIKHTRNAYLIGNYLDLGPAGIEVPQVELQSTVDEAIANFYYPPAGIRSWGGTVRVGIGDHPDRLDYADWWAGTGVLWLQIESLDAVTNARRLARPGVDCLSFGPADLGFDLESNPGHPLKTVDDCYRHLIDQLDGYAAAPCLRAYSRDELDKFRDMGAQMVLVPMTVDVR
jgi:2-keto-3-deoxy-L-rhamnonate aldolase RhmA